jgi:hypothetical protein
MPIPGLKPKDLCGIPWRVAFALQADGWWLRSDVIWSKPNPMPESVTDRPTRSHEYVFLLAKAERYFYDAVAVSEPAVASERITMPTRSAAARISGGLAIGQAAHVGNRIGIRNRRSVWEITTQAYNGSHFAVFPEELARLCIAAGTSERGCCARCGAPWERIVDRVVSFESGRAGNMPLGKNGPRLQGGGETLDVRRGPTVHSTTIGWQPTCRCDTQETKACLVLDPFCGSGTVCEVAYKMGRTGIGIDLKHDYLRLAQDREPPMAKFGFVYV